MRKSYFSQIGREFTVGELENFKGETRYFLSDVIDKIEKFIVHRHYVNLAS